jgi:hypothetical protein
MKIIENDLLPHRLFYSMLRIFAEEGIEEETVREWVYSELCNYQDIIDKNSKLEKKLSRKENLN